MTTTSIEERHFTLETVAKRLDTSTKTVRRLVKQGLLELEYLPGVRGPRIKESVLLAYEAKATKKPPEEP
jgi:excisionase family DNA binding protein